MANFVFWADTGVLVSLKSFFRNGESEVSIITVAHSVSSPGWLVDALIYSLLELVASHVSSCCSNKLRLSVP